MPDDPFEPEDFVIASMEYGTKKGKAAWRIHLEFLKGTPKYLRRVLDRAGLASFEELEALPNPAIQLPVLFGRREVAPLVDWLESTPAGDRAALLKGKAGLHRVVAVIEVLERCRGRWSTAPKEALDLSRVALALIEYLPDEDELALTVGEKPDLQARAWAYQGNVHRLLGDLRQAEFCFGKAKRALEECWLDDRTEAEVFCLNASLLRAQRRFGAARAAINRAIQIYEDHEEGAELGKALLVGVALSCIAEEWERGLRDLDRAVPLLDTASNPLLELSALNARLRLLHLAGQDELAAQHLPEAEIRAQEIGRPTDRLRILWCKAEIFEGQGYLMKSEELYRQVRAGFILADSAFDMALVSLCLAALYLDQSRWPEIRHLATEAIPLFEARDVHREALAAWRLFAEAAQQEALEQATVERLRKYLEAARLDPSYRYSP